MIVIASLHRTSGNENFTSSADNRRARGSGNCACRRFASQLVAYQGNSISFEMAILQRTNDLSLIASAKVKDILSGTTLELGKVIVKVFQQVEKIHKLRFQDWKFKFGFQFQSIESWNQNEMFCLLLFVLSEDLN